MASNVINVDACKLMHEVTFTVHVRRMHEMKLRMAIALLLVKLAVRITGAKSNIAVEDDD